VRGVTHPHMPFERQRCPCFAHVRLLHTHLPPLQENWIFSSLAPLSQNPSPVQLQSPLPQEKPIKHECPQVPQLLSSLDVLVHPDVQHVCPAPHALPAATQLQIDLPFTFAQFSPGLHADGSSLQVHSLPLQ